MTPNEVESSRPPRPPGLKQYVWVMRMYGFLYAFVGSLFFLFPDHITTVLNLVPTYLHYGTPIPNSSEHFWLVLSTSMMMMLSALSFLAAESPRTRGYALVHLLSKLVSSAGFFYMYANHAPYFGYLVGIITDFPIALVILFILTRSSVALRRLDREASAAQGAAPA